MIRLTKTAYLSSSKTLESYEDGMSTFYIFNDEGLHYRLFLFLQDLVEFLYGTGIGKYINHTQEQYDRLDNEPLLQVIG